MLIDVETACKLLKKNDNFLIIAHQKPDGDTFGASFALYWALKSMGKKVRVKCADGFGERYRFIYGAYKPDKDFTVEFVVTADIAGMQLLGHFAPKYEGRVDLCIDHHKSNEMYARHTLLDITAPATCQIMLEVVRGLGVTIDKLIANALFTGLSTDTGCFKYASVTAKTHRAAADMIDCGADHAMINKLMFDTKSRGQLAVDRLMMENLEFYLEDRCAVVTLPPGITETCGVTEDELDGISAFSARLKGVLAGVTIRQIHEETYRCSLRTAGPVDASKICVQFGGGGHANAAGCTIKGGGAQDVKARLIAAVEKELEQAAS